MSVASGDAPSPSRLAEWWSFEERLDHVASYAALALGLGALVASLVLLL